LTEELGLGDNVIEILQRLMTDHFQYVNWIRFQRTLCSGCVASSAECDVAYGRNRGKGVWERIVNGEKFTKCPARGDGTFMVNSHTGEMKILDLSKGESYNVVEPLERDQE